MAENFRLLTVALFIILPGRGSCIQPAGLPINFQLLSYKSYVVGLFLLGFIVVSIFRFLWLGSCHWKEGLVVLSKSWEIGQKVDRK